MTILLSLLVLAGLIIVTVAALAAREEESNVTYSEHKLNITLYDKYKNWDSKHCPYYE